MGVVAGQLAALTVTVSSPDARMRATVTAGKPRSFGFRPNTYRFYTEDRLGHQLARLATLAYIGHQRGVDRIHAENDMTVIRDPRQARDPAEATFVERSNSITVAGVGARKMVRFKTTGMLNWQCRIAEGTVRRLSEKEFVSEVSLAVNDVLGKTHSIAMLLKDEYRGRVLSHDVRERLIAELSAA
ncbi:hypothetical protein [Stackebrandtia nassauensis]|uniref:Uncharacterized protein n=1 Tax=Stackebrandtia nassauensis (strain DSM 44728 / CIP 108903 / NRRL B-16338 / NBRC 102104 / LLR-40K-21) TaxID=446470 RepID=D3QAB6_STANL|nr:hypothetical protein [Stackebrandtia nassauensis]ADD42699.1 hypothetical protein Snas_3028 [Stackebrandtia nassauensis DSM 44728]